MKIYSRFEFMKLPAGIIFTSGPPYAFSDLMIKGESLEVDFLQSPLVGSIESKSSEEHADRMYEMEGKGASYPISKSYGREGLFDDEMIYTVYEKEDLEYLIGVLKEAIEVGK